MPEGEPPQNHPAPATVPEAAAADAAAPAPDIATARTGLAAGTPAEQAEDIQERVARIIRRFSLRG